MARASFAAVALAVLLAIALLPSFAHAADQKPKVPPDRDPGGFAIAVIGPGIDYTRPDIAGRLARDGEGEIVGFDLYDNDRKPYLKSEAASDCGDIGCNALPAHLALAEGQATRLAPFRTDTRDERMLARAIGMVAKSPARVVLIDGPASERVLAAAPERFPALVFIAPAAAEAQAAGTSSPVSVIRVAAALGAPGAEPRADIIAPAGGRVLPELAACKPPCAFPPELADRLAAARIAALAARLVAVEPALDGAGLKARILKLAADPAAPGLIAEPHRPFWLE